MEYSFDGYDVKIDSSMPYPIMIKIKDIVVYLTLDELMDMLKNYISDLKGDKTR